MDMVSTDVAGRGGAGEEDNEAENDHGGISHPHVTHRTLARTRTRPVLPVRPLC